MTRPAFVQYLAVLLMFIRIAFAMRDHSNNNNNSHHHHNNNHRNQNSNTNNNGTDIWPPILAETMINGMGPNWRNNDSSINTLHKSNVYLKLYGEKGAVISQRSVGDIHENADLVAKCDTRGRFAIVVHGWRESCHTDWVGKLVDQLRKHRGGCIMCFDYAHYAYEMYPRLVRHFDPIANALTTVLMQLDTLGFRMAHGYAFGFSFGGQLVVEAGRRIGFFRLSEVDTCDMAGPGFDYRLQHDHRLAAINVQCIHTSLDKGTRHFGCHQNWRLGNCGYGQAAAGEPPLGSHGLCPYMYISAFEHAFLAVDRTLECPSRTPATNWPEGYRMGYMETRKLKVVGELFALTAKDYPYAVDDHVNSSNISIK